MYTEVSTVRYEMSRQNNYSVQETVFGSWRGRPSGSVGGDRCRRCIMGRLHNTSLTRQKFYLGQIKLLLLGPFCPLIGLRLG